MAARRGKINPLVRRCSGFSRWLAKTRTLPVRAAFAVLGVRLRSQSRRLSSDLLLRPGAADVDGDLLDFGPPGGITDLNAHDIGA